MTEVTEIKATPPTVFGACELGLVADVQKSLDNTSDTFNIDALGGNDYTLLMIAAKTGNDEIVKLLLSKKADPNVKGNRGLTALLVACQNGYQSTTQLLLDCETKADLSVTDDNGNNGLMYAAMNGSLFIAELLIKAGIDVNATNKNKGTALSFGVLFGKENLIEFLLDNGATVDAQDERGNTSLHFAASCGYRKVITLLKERGAKTDIENVQCKTPKQMSDQQNIT
eukprot:179469_1